MQWTLCIAMTKAFRFGSIRLRCCLSNYIYEDKDKVVALFIAVKPKKSTAEKDTHVERYYQNDLNFA